VTAAAAAASRTSGTLRVAVAQLGAVPGNEAGNAARILEVVRSNDAELVVTPELSLTGYDLGDDVHRLARPVAPGARLAALGDLPPDRETVVGLVERAPGGPFNTAVVLRGGSVAHRHRKIYLPTYGMFDEARWFGRGTSLDVWPLAGGWLAGALICEDLWHPGLTYVLATRGIDVLLVLAAAPGRGVWEGGERGPFRSADVWERIVRTTAQLYGIYVVLANRVGVEGPVMFAGGSLVVDPHGGVLARGGVDETVLTADLTQDRLAAARVPYSHARDDLPALVARELQRVTHVAR
jgi:predicted amidohydrolase